MLGTTVIATATSADSGGPPAPLFATVTVRLTTAPTVESAPKTTTESWPEAASIAKTPPGLLAATMLKLSTSPVAGTSRPSEEAKRLSAGDSVWLSVARA